MLNRLLMRFMLLYKDGVVDCDDPDCCSEVACSKLETCVSVPDPTNLVQTNVSTTQVFDEQISFIYKVCIYVWQMIAI